MRNSKFPSRAVQPPSSSSQGLLFAALLGIFLLSACGGFPRWLSPPRGPDLNDAEHLILDVKEMLEFVQARRVEVLTLVRDLYEQRQVSEPTYNAFRRIGNSVEAAQRTLLDELDRFQALYYSAPDRGNDPTFRRQQERLIERRLLLKTAVRELELLLLEEIGG